MSTVATPSPPPKYYEGQLVYRVNNDSIDVVGKVIKVEGDRAISDIVTSFYNGTMKVLPDDNEYYQVDKNVIIKQYQEKIASTKHYLKNYKKSVKDHKERLDIQEKELEKFIKEK